MSRVQLHHLCPPFLVQFLLGTPLCVVSTTWVSCSTTVRIQHVLSQVHTIGWHVCHSPAHPFVGLLVPAACSLLSHSTDCQHTDSRIVNTKHYHLQHASHNVFSLLLLASTAGIHRCGQACRPKLLASTSCSIWLHPLNGFAPSPPLHNFSSVVLAPDRTIGRSPGSLHLEFFTTHPQCRTIQPINT